MVKITETGHADAIDEDRIQIFVSTGRGNTAGLPEIHIEVLDPLTGQSIAAWYFKDELLAAILDPDPTPIPSEVLGVITEEPTA